MNFHRKKILVIGAGVSGFAAAMIGRKLGADVVLSDAKPEQELKYDFKKFRAAGIKLFFGKQEDGLLTDVDLIIVSPAVPISTPLVKKALQCGIQVISEIELAQNLAQSPFYAVTGTNGKTTTVTLLGLLIATMYGKDKTGVGGNIGVSLSDEALRIGSNGGIVAEISSYQLEATNHFHPHVSAVLNVTPDHIVRHGSMEVYQKMKERIFHEETNDDFLVLNYDDERTRSMAERTKARVCFFSRKEELQEGACLQGDTLVIRWDNQCWPLCTVNDLGIKGSHNVENALAASAMAFLAGCKPEKMIPVLESFRGVEHRIEYFATIDGIPYYNDSKATNTDSAIKALETFPAHIVLLAGGDDKMTDLTDFMQLVKERVDELILLGNASERFHKAAVKQGIEEVHIHEAGYSMEKAVAIAHSLAHVPQVVLLSPACASFDMYDGMAQRGRDFKRLVRKFQH
ncbi:UDP-N-acetylmuramoyl-L-alanine--D-glutamate ligase [Pectinatus sottacetonis]|uniref:UDP-N-acetylmuramoyl-L-alanine--D-glutamate ligase n=1 Tax=Pectinatus sottacetonis TaxID=1002795 RepID=UPI0018C800CF